MKIAQKTKKKVFRWDAQGEIRRGGNHNMSQARAITQREGAANTPHRDRRPEGKSLECGTRLRNGKKEKKKNTGSCKSAQ